MQQHESPIWTDRDDTPRPGIESERSQWHRYLIWTTFVECFCDVCLMASWIHLVSYSHSGHPRLFGADAWIIIPLISIVTALLVNISSSRSERPATLFVAIRVLLWIGLTLVLILTFCRVMELHKGNIWKQGNIAAQWIIIISTCSFWFVMICNLVSLYFRVGELKELERGGRSDGGGGPRNRVISISIDSIR